MQKQTCTNCKELLPSTSKYFHKGKRQCRVCMQMISILRMGLGLSFVVVGSQMDIERPLKKCSMCKNDFPRTENNFHKHSKNKDGLQGVCKGCYSLRAKEAYQVNPDRLRLWNINNPHLHNARTAKRRAALLQAVPTWVDYKQLREIYQNCPSEKVVDHIVPLQNEIVCGLHVPWNLQYLTTAENSSKGNKLCQTRIQ